MVDPLRIDPKLSIAKKMARSNFFASGMALVLATTAFLSYDFLSFRRTIVETLSGYADIIGINSSSALLFDDKKAATETLGSLSVRPDILEAVIYDADGRKFAVYHVPAAQEQPSESLNTAKRGAHWLSNGHLVLVRDIYFHKQYLGAVYLEAGLDEMRERAIRYMWIGIGVFFASMLLSWLVARQLQRRITGPIFGLTRLAERVSREVDYSARAVKQSDDEVGVLADAFNNMLSQIERQNDALNRARDQLEQRVEERTHELAEEVEIRRRAEERVRENEERFRTLVESAPDAVITIDSAGRIALVNSQAEKLFGYGRDELLGQRVAKLVPPEYQNMDWGRDFGMTDELGNEFGRELEGLSKSGKRVAIEVRLSPIHTREGRLVLALISDIGARKDAERAIKALNIQLGEKVTELTAVNNELEAFSYSVSHDLRAPLRGIDGFSQSLLEDYADRLDPTAKSYLDRICAAAQRMGMLIDDLLNLSRITRASLVRGTVDLSALVEAILTQLATGDRARAVRVRIEPGVVANVDARLVRIALENLLSNAWKFTRHTLDAVIEFGMLEQQGNAVYFIRDNGAGFNMDYAGKLFEAFQRLHTEREYEGTGIGLAIVQRVIQRHGGRIWAEGSTGQGATFYFTMGS